MIDGKATLHELETTMSYQDMRDLNEVLDAVQGAEYEWHKRNTNKP